MPSNGQGLKGANQRHRTQTWLNPVFTPVLTTNFLPKLLDFVFTILVDQAISTIQMLKGNKNFDKQYVPLAYCSSHVFFKLLFFFCFCLTVFTEQEQIRASTKRQPKGLACLHEWKCSKSLWFGCMDCGESCQTHFHTDVSRRKDRAVLALLFLNDP